jgi:Family of unknown function (DUF5681)
MSHDDERDYKVGYGKPPHHTRFRRGQSGNPRGRPAGSRNLATLVNEALNEPVIVVENGGRRKISKREAIIKQLVNRSAKADWRAIKILLDMVRELEGRIEPETAESSFSAADEKVIEQIKVRWHSKKGDSDA